MYNVRSRKPVFLCLLIFTLAVSLYTLSFNTPSRRLASFLPISLDPLPPTPYTPPPTPEPLCQRCSGKGSEVCSSTGEAAVARSVNYSGTNARLRRFLHKLRSGQPVKISVIGGSVSVGQGLDGVENSPDLVHKRIFSFLNATYPHPDHTLPNGAIGATGSDYFQYCFSEEHIPRDSDPVLMELGVNDEWPIKTQRSYEMLLRTVLELPNSPAVISIEMFSLLFATIANGGDLHLPLNVFYDVNTVSLRSAILPSIMRDPMSYAPWYSLLENGEPDKRHLGAKGHRLTGDLVVAYLDQQLCEMDRLKNRFGAGSIQTDWDAIGLRDTSPPPMLLTEKFIVDRTVGCAKPQCQSTNSPKTKLTVPPGSIGWKEWSSSQYKNYLISTTPGSRISLPFSTALGRVIVSYLRSAAYDLGQVDCWVNSAQDRKVRLDGFWDLTINIGRTMEIRNDLTPGDHTLHCEVVERTRSKGHESRLISVMSL